MAELIYLDNAATTPLLKEVADAMHEHNLETFGNPSSLHSLGRKSKKLLGEARKTLASKINAKAHEIFFLNNATEANNLVFQGLKNYYDLIITTPFEHPSVLEAAKAINKKIIYLNLDEEGFINLKELEDILQNNSHCERSEAIHGSPRFTCDGKKRILVSIMHGNNEIGTVNDLEAIGKLCKEHNVYFHSDCVQTFTKLDIDVEKMNLDFISTSAHKIHGPKGIGFLYKRSGIELEPMIIGGGQEANLKSGTENIVSIIGFEEAVKNDAKVDHLKNLQEKLINALSQISGLEINGPKDLSKRVPGNINVSVPKFSSEQMLLQLDLKDLCASSGSACSSSKMADVFGGNGSAPQIISSYVLRACKLPEQRCKSAVRLSLSKLNTEAEIDKTIAAFKLLLA